MWRIVLLSVTGAMILAGLSGFPYGPGLAGTVLDVALPIAGTVLFWVFERRTRHHLDEDSTRNRAMKVVGEILVLRDRD